MRKRKKKPPTLPAHKLIRVHISVHSISLFFASSVRSENQSMRKSRSTPQDACGGAQPRSSARIASQPRQNYANLAAGPPISEDETGVVRLFAAPMCTQGSAALLSSRGAKCALICDVSFRASRDRYSCRVAQHVKSMHPLMHSRNHPCPAPLSPSAAPPLPRRDLMSLLPLLSLSRPRLFRRFRKWVPQTRYLRPGCRHPLR